VSSKSTLAGLDTTERNEWTLHESWAIFSLISCFGAFIRDTRGAIYTTTTSLDRSVNQQLYSQAVLTIYPAYKS
jgi:hypothetical protein